MTTAKNNSPTTAEDRKLRDYELVFIIKPDLEAEALEAAVSRVKQLITGKDGVIIGEEHWGKRRLAYPLKHFLEGDYVLTQFKIQPKWTKELETNLRISEEILRHLLVKV